MRLHRPSVPASVQVEVAYRILRAEEPPQLKTLPIKRRLAIARYSLGERLGCDERDLRLDHDPPLAVRAYDAQTRRYVPDANDPEHLYWVTAETHRVKTFVRGANGQFSDVQLIKRERRRKRRLLKRKRKYFWPKGRKIQSRPFRSKSTRPGYPRGKDASPPR